MFVQRLTNWLRRIFASLSTRVRAAPSLRHDDSTVMSGCTTGQRAHEQNGSGASSGSWLADGRALRPRPVPQSASEPRWTVRGVAPRQQPPVDQPRRAMPGQPVPAHPAAEATPADAAPARAQQPPQPAPPSQPARLTSASLHAPDDSDIHDQALYRRLMSLKRLVRLGIYGEGFDAQHVPEQYLHSLGRDDDFDTFGSEWDELPGD